MYDVQPRRQAPSWIRSTALASATLVKKLGGLLSTDR
jgi:hypothetical protein